ncbi:MAG: thioredoxin fold domain-containing protein [Candidatus Omnitrophica bacterium]|nr:thioredoxin fold domain-containing protein [Candidatus Omnitrophota bacterium]
MKNLMGIICLIFVFCAYSQGFVHSSQMPWKTYSKEALADSLAKGIPVVIDFSADWCGVCHELEEQVFPRPEIQAKLAKFTALKVDVTDQESPAVQKIAGEYGLEGVPTLIFLNSHGQEIENARIVGFITAKELSEVLTYCQTHD